MDRETFRKQFAAALDAGYSPRQVQEAEEALQEFSDLDDELKDVKARHKLAKTTLEKVARKLGGRYAFGPGFLAIKLGAGSRNTPLPGAEEHED